MIFRELRLKGVFVIEVEPREDPRGGFARSFCEREFAGQGLVTHWVQCNLSWNVKQGTLRGLHYQLAPHEEAKLVRCSRGMVHDVIVDVRKGSPTYMQWEAVELSADNRRSVYIPVGFAHGFQTLQDHSEVFYQMSEFYHPEASAGLRWNDPAFGIRWPLSEPVLSEKDAHYKDFIP